MPILRLISGLNEVLGRVVAVLLVIAVTATVYEVCARYLFNAPTVWAHELTILLCAALFLIGGPYVTKRQSHIAITSIYRLLPERARFALDILHGLLALGFLALFTYAAWQNGHTALTRWETTGSAWNPPTPALIKPLIAVAGGLMMLQVAVNLVLRVVDGKRPAAPPATDA